MYAIDPSLLRAATPQEYVRAPVSSVSASTNHWSARSTRPGFAGLVEKFIRHMLAGGTASRPDAVIVALIHVAPFTSWHP